MAENLGKWRSKREPISKFGLSNGGKAGAAPLALGLWYDFHEYEWHLGNVGSRPRQASRDGLTTLGIDRTDCREAEEFNA